ncbi:Uu.00g037060.m01.CDS01 [Anthostomella pinea]|uniref:Uu.00g037060.m01.CDS01 n=1 Tax=Anthostomella pinea TaxID=933095 RepID=A0AAI8YDR4_9PEZI|nr:Uu.00g037060.m01.CDS01 [Anthostomella pinea]
MMIYINSFGRESLSLSELESINLVLISNAVAILARPIFGFLADRYVGAMNSWSVNSIGLGIPAFGWIGVKTRAGLYAYSVVMGFTNGAAQGVFPGASSSLVNDISKMGSWVGMAYALVGLGTLAGSPALGAIIDASGGKYLWGQVWAGVVVIVGALLILTTSWLVAVKGKRGLWAKA